MKTGWQAYTPLIVLCIVAGLVMSGALLKRLQNEPCHIARNCQTYQDGTPQRDPASTFREDINSEAAETGTSQNDSEAREDRYAEWSARADIVQAIVGVIGIIGLFATVLYARKAWNQSIQATELAEKTTVMGQRAYMSVNRVHTRAVGRVRTKKDQPDIPFMKGDLQPEMFQCLPIWRNSGATPALGAQFASAILPVLKGGDLDLLIKVQREGIPAVTVGAGTEYPSIVGHISVEHFLAAERGDLRLFLLTVCFYDDIFLGKLPTGASHTVLSAFELKPAHDLQAPIRNDGLERKYVIVTPYHRVRLELLEGDHHEHVGWINHDHHP